MLVFCVSLVILENYSTRFWHLRNRIFIVSAKIITLPSTLKFIVRFPRNTSTSSMKNKKSGFRLVLVEFLNDFFCFSVTLEVIDDDVFEPDEHFYIRLTQSQPAECLGSPTLATVIILDDDHGGLFK